MEQFFTVIYPDVIVNERLGRVRGWKVAEAGIVLHLVAPFGGIRRGEEENSSGRQSRANPFQSGERGEIEMLQHFGHEDYIEDARRRYGVELNIALREVEA